MRVEVQEDDLPEVAVIEVSQHVEQQSNDFLDMAVEGTGKVFVWEEGAGQAHVRSERRDIPNLVGNTDSSLTVL